MAILFHSLIKRRLAAQKIVYLNLVLAETLFSLVGCTLRGPGKQVKSRKLINGTIYILGIITRGGIDFFDC